VSLTSYQRVRDNLDDGFEDVFIADARAHDLPELAANLPGFQEGVREEAACLGGRRGDGAENAGVLVSDRAPLEAGAQARGGQGEDIAMRRQILSMGRESVSVWGESLAMQREDVSVFAADLSS
jgi:hypothetical protein